MGKKAKKRAEAEKAELRRRAHHKRTLQSAVEFIDSAMADPDWYAVTCDRIMLIRCLGNMIDNLLYDTDRFIGFADVDKTTRQMVSKVRRNIDDLLDHLLRDSVKRFGARNAAAGRPEGKEFEDVSRIAAALQGLCEMYIGWFLDSPWRQAELDRLMDRLVPDDAVRARREKTLEELHRSYDETRETIARALETDMMKEV